MDVIYKGIGRNSKLKDIKELRKNIDSIDEKIINLFEERMEIVVEVAKYKKDNNFPIFNEDREKEVIDKNIRKLKNKNIDKYCEKFLQAMMDVSKAYQKQMLEE